MRLFDMCVEKNLLNSFRYHKFLTVFRVDFVINQAKTFLSTSLKVRRPHGLCARSPSEQSGFFALAGDTVLCSWARHFTFSVPLSIQQYKWVPAGCWGNLTNCGGGACDLLTSCSEGVEYS